MNRGKQKIIPHTGGYTIVEVLIFLAVSSLLFVMAMMLISGQQNKAQFVNATRDFESIINDVANDVSTGYYLNPGGFNCNTSGNIPQITATPSARPLGTNIQCIFIGRVIKFGLGSTADENKYMLLSVVGARTATNGTPVASLSAANPRAIDTTNAISTSTLGYGTTVECVAVGNSCNPSDNTNAAIGFFSRFSNNLSSVGGAQTDVVPFANVNISDNQAATIGHINTVAISGTGTNYANVAKNPADGVTICLKSGGTRQYALVHLGSNSSSNLVVTTEIKPDNGGSSLCS